MNITYVLRDGTEKRIRGKIGDNVMYLSHRWVHLDQSVLPVHLKFLLKLLSLVSEFYIVSLEGATRRWYQLHMQESIAFGRVKFLSSPSESARRRLTCLGWLYARQLALSARKKSDGHANHSLRNVDTLSFHAMSWGNVPWSMRQYLTFWCKPGVVHCILGRWEEATMT